MVKVFLDALCHTVVCNNQSVFLPSISAPPEAPISMYLYTLLYEIDIKVPKPWMPLVSLKTSTNSIKTFNDTKGNYALDIMVIIFKCNFTIFISCRL